jgi:hypothetical protein
MMGYRGRTQLLNLILVPYRPQIVLGAEIMKPKKFEVKIYYSGFCTYQIESKNEAEAIIRARNRQIDSIELLSNLENWKEADTAELNDYENY